MEDDVQRPSAPPLEGAPTWVRIVQAALVGIIAGLALHALLSVVVLHGKGLWPDNNRSECRKNTPPPIARDAGTRS